MPVVLTVRLSDALYFPSPMILCMHNIQSIGVVKMILFNKVTILAAYLLSTVVIAVTLNSMAVGGLYLAFHEENVSLGSVISKTL